MILLLLHLGILAVMFASGGMQSSLGSSGRSTARCLGFAVCLLLGRVAHCLDQVQTHGKCQEDAGYLQALVALSKDCSRTCPNDLRVYHGVNPQLHAALEGPRMWEVLTCLCFEAPPTQDETAPPTKD